MRINIERARRYGLGREKENKKNKKRVIEEDDSRESGAVSKEWIRVN